MALRVAGARMSRRDRRGRRIGRNWWRESICEQLAAAGQAWWLDREAVALGYATEKVEYAGAFPRPTLKGFLIANAGQASR